MTRPDLIYHEHSKLGTTPNKELTAQVVSSPLIFSLITGR